MAIGTQSISESELQVALDPLGALADAKLKKDVKQTWLADAKPAVSQRRQSA